jgi:hypothetical protein
MHRPQALPASSNFIFKKIYVSGSRLRPRVLGKPVCLLSKI